MTRATELFQEFSRDASADRARDLKKTKFIAIENNIRTVPPGVQENQQSPVVSPSVQSRFAHGGPFCHHCGSHVDEYAHFCGQCGSKLRVKSSQRIAKIFFIIGMIAIPIIIFEVGSLIFLLNKKIGAPSSAPELIQPASEQPAALPPAVQKDKKTIVKMEPAPVPEKSIANVPNKEHQAIAPEPMKPVATKAETFKPAPPVYEAPKPAPAAVEAPKPAPKKVEAAEAPKPAPAAVEVPKPAPAAVEAPKPLPATVQAPAAAVTGAGAAKKKTAVDDYLSKAEGAAPQENAKNATVNQSALEDNLKLARLYMGIGSYDDAISRYREVVKTDPYNQEAIQGLMQAKKMKATTSGK